MATIAPAHQQCRPCSPSWNHHRTRRNHLGRGGVVMLVKTALAITSVGATACASTPIRARGPSAADIVQQEYHWTCRVPQEENPQVLIAYSQCPKSAEAIVCEHGGDATEVRCDYLIRSSLGRPLRFAGRSYKLNGSQWALDPSTGSAANPDIILQHQEKR